MTAALLSGAPSRQVQRRLGVEIRLAKDRDAGFLRGLFAGPEFAWLREIDWKHIEPYWCIAMLGEQPVGALQVCHGTPFGRIEFLAVVAGLRPLIEMKVKATLIDYGCELLRRGGAQVAMGIVYDGDPSYKEAVEKRGWVALAHGQYLAKRL